MSDVEREVLAFREALSQWRVARLQRVEREVQPDQERRMRVHHALNEVELRMALERKAKKHGSN